MGVKVIEWISGLISVELVSNAPGNDDRHAHSNNHHGSRQGNWIRSPRRWIVKTESNVRREKKKLPDPPCVICKGTGRVKCNRCCGRGRTNYPELVMLPKGEWPKWCWDCSGCGMSFCTRCFGTGEKRGIIGFHLPEDNDN